MFKLYIHFIVENNNDSLMNFDWWTLYEYSDIRKSDHFPIRSPKKSHRSDDSKAVVEYSKSLQSWNQTSWIRTRLPLFQNKNAKIYYGNRNSSYSPHINDTWYVTTQFSKSIGEWWSLKIIWCKSTLDCRLFLMNCDLFSMFTMIPQKFYIKQDVAEFISCHFAQI